MPYSAPTSDEYNHFRWLRRDIEFSEVFDPFLAHHASNVIRHVGKKPRKDLFLNIHNALSVILCNLYRSHLADPNRYVAIDSSNDGYPKSEYNPVGLGIRAIRYSLSYLTESDPPFVESRGGNYDVDRGRGYVRVFRLTEVLFNEIDSFIFNGGSNISIIETVPPVIRNTFYNNQNNIFNKPLFIQHDLPLIRLKDEPDETGKSRYISFKGTDDTKRMEDNLRSYNHYLAEEYWIDLMVPHDQFQTIGRRQDNERDGFGDIKDQQLDLDLLHRNSLYRVFNNGRFDQGGRYYGGWWQNIPSDLRRWITINGYPVAELDYSNMQIAMLYAQEGMRLEGDAYTVDGIPEQYRKFLKTTMFKIINATGKMRAPLKSERPEGWEWNQIVDALSEKHRYISQYFFSGIGLSLQRTDSDIAETVMMDLKGKGVLALPVHDSFLVMEKHGDLLQQSMQDAYRHHTGHQIQIDADPSFMDLLPPNAAEMVENDEREWDDWIWDVINQEEYKYYNERANAFIDYKGVEWLDKVDFFGGHLLSIIRSDGHVPV